MSNSRPNKYREPHAGVQERIRNALRGTGQKFYLVQTRAENGKFVDTTEVVVTAELHRHEFYRRMTKKEVIAHITEAHRKQVVEEQARKQAEKLLFKPDSYLTNSIK